MKKIVLSVAIATYNEEENIVDCIKSLKDLADEIIVVDGTSQDRTAELAKRLGAKVFQVPNKKMFHINKNIAITKSSGDWVLVLDADERVSTSLAAEIKTKIKSNPPENGFWLNRKNWFLGDYLKKGGAYPDPVIRLFKKGKGNHEEKTVHEQIKIDGKVGRLEKDILHLADPSFARYLNRAVRYTDETALKLGEQKTQKNILAIIYFMIVKPVSVFLNIYLRHSGYKDGYRGFIWALFSGFHHYYAYIKYLTSKDSFKAKNT